MAPSFSVCIATVRPDRLRAAIRSALEQSLPPLEVLVLGQGARRHELRRTAEAAAAGDARLRYVDLPRTGLSRARNAAVALAAAEVIAFLDDDCEAAADWLLRLAEGFGRREDVGVVGGAVVAPPPLRRPSSCPVMAPSDALYDPAAAPRTPPAGWDWMGANVAIRAEVARRIGRWDECLGAGADFPAGEDTDYKLRLEAAGVAMVTTPAASVLHAGGTRYGLDVLRSQRAYASGNGALAAKQTLCGDARGLEWLRRSRGEALSSLLRPRRLVRDVRRHWYFERAYRRCLRDYAVGADGLLRRRRQRHGADDRAEPRVTLDELRPGE